MTTIHLPGQPTPFVGRNQELAEISRLLSEPDCRLLTLVGPGGIGKTRLAIQVGSTNAQRFSENVHFIPLAPVGTPDLLISTIAEQLGIQLESHEAPQDQLLQYLHDRSMLLVIDNFEHLLDGAKLLADMVSETPGIKILVTSRERLNLVEEYVFDVRGLPYPETSETGDLGVHDAVQLFLGHAQRAKVGFSPSATDMQAVAHICRLAEGMPLAIELAAVWVRSLSCDEIAREIEHSLDLYSTPLRNIPERHRNMRAVIAYSWERLDEADRTVFQSLSVFRGSFDREAATQVADASLHSLSTLVDRSLLRSTSSGRYELHELLRQFAEEQLATIPNEQKAAHDRHSTHYAEFMSQRTRGMFFSWVKEIVGEVEQEIDNIRAAWHWSSQYGYLDNLAMSAEGLWIFHELKSRFREGESLFSQAVKAMAGYSKSEQQQLTLGQLMFMQATFFGRQGRYEEAVNLLENGLEILGDYGPRQEAADIRQGMGFTILYQGQYEDALRYFQESLEIYQDTGDPGRIAWALYGLSYASNALGNYEEAARQARKSIGLARETGGVPQVTDCLTLYSQILKQLGQYDEAIQSAQGAYRLASELDSPQRAARALLALGEIHTAQADYEQARTFFYRALQIAIDIPMVRLQLAALAGIAELLLHDGEQAFAEQLLSLAYHHPSCEHETRKQVEDLQPNLSPHLPDDHVKTLSQAIEALYTLPQFARLEAAEKALQRNPTTSDTPALQVMSDPLTPREIEVLVLAAEGLSNQEIADRLVIGLSTVKKHINHIYGKLAVKSRTQAINRARELGLL